MMTDDTTMDNESKVFIGLFDPKQPAAATRNIQ
jgi:hypothetical protein